MVDENAKGYIEASLQEGTTPLVKKMNGKYIRSFKNFMYPGSSENDFQGPRSILYKNFKLILAENGNGLELYDLKKDRAETNNIADAHPEVVTELNEKLLNWQESVLNSLTGADYKK